MLFNYKNFVTSEQNLKNVIKLLSPKIPILDYAIEHNKDKDNFRIKYSQLLQTFPNNYHALKLSSIDFCFKTADILINEARKNNCKIMIDAEEHDSIHKVNWDSDILTWKYNKKHFQIYKTYQMYRKDSMETLLNDLNKYQIEGLYHGIKLVRGAYLYQDKNKGVLWENKQLVDENYEKAMKHLLNINNDKLSIIFATHNRDNFDIIQYNNDVYHATLMGLHHNYDKNHKSMVYIPFGPLYKIAPYLLRRLYENNFIFNLEKNKEPELAYA